MQILKTLTWVGVNGIGIRALTGRRSIFLFLAGLLAAASFAARAEAQLPDAPSASVIAPLKRFSLNMGLDNKYSLTTSLYDLTPRAGVSMRLGERETLGLSYSHATVMNNKHAQNNSVVMWLNLRVCSWGKIPQER